MHLNNERGVTLIELLVTIVIMVAVTTPIVMMVSLAMNTEREVSVQNDIQREARLIMERVTEKMRDKNVIWTNAQSENKWELVCVLENVEGTRCSDVYLTYEVVNGLGTMKLGENGPVLSEHITYFNHPNYEAGRSNPVEVKLQITKSGRSIELTTNIYYDRF
ncbi:PilW family protein [Halalkalibacter alkaliphilus]|uniref:Prepilin-type N-terminal cleavage/methylation domain-containing protein n=1 Tax=Halalkalibacter alkaliphilus TaxID=2917993 RepID=A0A9X2CTT8_9BACI|nr:prepilin-type N-terminal cleavage/methylation domain-containing protein [Halalkalibacter alkaliphilus]MCL7748096.1 prepilin-type N-terminal cleavage/methylation domain-containing protein [Halalkalibacter alkaliphilus]